MKSRKSLTNFYEAHAHDTHTSFGKNKKKTNKLIKCGSILEN